MDSEPLRSFAARVINLCYEVEGAVALTNLQALKNVAYMIRIEAEQVQSIYGGHPSKPPKSVKEATSVKLKTVKKKK